VGIGMTIPQVKFHIKDSDEINRMESTSLNSYMSIFNSNGYIGYVGTYWGDSDIDIGTGVGNTTGNLHLVTQAAPKMTIKSDGNVGIGMTDPANNLHVYGGTYTHVNFQNSTTGQSSSDGLNFFISGYNAYIRNQEAANLYLGTDNSTDVTIESGGDVGIQTTNPEASLDVNGDVIIGENGVRFLEIKEISGITGDLTETYYGNALPPGWTGEKTRVLSLEIQYGDSGLGNWLAIGYSNALGKIACYLDHDGRGFGLYYPLDPYFHGSPWRAVIMRMP
jgi:hypothetical protein